MVTIRVTPEELREQGEALVGKVGDVNDILTEIGDKVTEIIDAWDGLAQDAYYDMYTEMKTSLDKFPELVQSLGNATIAAANAFADVDANVESALKNSNS